MEVEMMTIHQVKCLFKHYGQTGNIELSAMKSGMSRKTGSKYIHTKKFPDEFLLTRDWRTREDPLKNIWDYAEAFLVDSPELEAKALLEHLIEKFPDQVDDSHLRTFQRRIKNWRIREGKNQEVFFDQDRQPGECMQMDWTDMNKLNVMVDGIHYLHKLCHLVLPYSNYEGAVRSCSESILSIKKGLKHFLYSLNATPAVLQIDNSSAATHRIKKDGAKREFNDELIKIAEYYGFSLRTTNIDCPNENGDVESLNGHIKKRIHQALLLRRSTEFESMEKYDCFLQTVFSKANKNRIKKLQEEIQVMNGIPAQPLPEYQEMYVSVRCSSTVHIKKVTYSIPSRLIGTSLKAMIYEEIIRLYNGADLVHEMPRVLGDRGQIINYRHVIHSLIRKPGAFKNYKFKEAMYPTDNFRLAYDRFISINGERVGCMEYLRTLKLASETMESEVDVALSLMLENSATNFSYKDIETLVNTKSETLASIDMGELVPDLTSYDNLIDKGDEDDICTNQPTTTEGPQPLSNAHLLRGGDGQGPERELVL